MGPGLGELAPPVDEIVEARPRVGPEPREEHLVVRWREDVDVVDLQEAELPDRAAEVADVDPAVRPRAIEALRFQGDAARFAQREIVSGHPLRSR